MPANRKTSERLRAKLERELPALLGTSAPARSRARAGPRCRRPSRSPSRPDRRNRREPVRGRWPPRADEPGQPRPRSCTGHTNKSWRRGDERACKCHPLGQRRDFRALRGYCRAHERPHHDGIWRSRGDHRSAPSPARWRQDRGAWPGSCRAARVRRARAWKLAPIRSRLHRAHPRRCGAPVPYWRGDHLAARGVAMTSVRERAIASAEAALNAWADQHMPGWRAHEVREDAP